MRAFLKESAGAFSDRKYDSTQALT